MHRFEPRRSRLFVAILSAISVSVQAAEADSNANSGKLEEIIVTAERVASSMQETPISLAVFDEKRLESLSVVESGDIAAYTPNLRMDKSPATLNAYAISIRGVGSGEPSLAVDPTVGIYLDGVYLARSSAAAFEVVDLERIEVLRGPQGTLYGRNSTGGAVNVITAKPAGEFGFKQEFTVGERDLFRSSTSVDTPTYGDFSAKLSFNYGERGGLVKSMYTGGDLGQYDQYAGRIAVRWTPTESLMADYSYDHYDQDSSTMLSQLSYVRPLNVLVGGPFYEQAEAASSADRMEHLPYIDDSKDQTTKIDGHALTFTLDLGEATLKSISSYRELDNRYDSQDFGEFPTDGSSVLTPNFDGTFVPAGTYVPTFTSLSGYNKQEQWSQEFQLIGRLFDDRFGYNMGLYYFHEEGSQADPQEFTIPALFAFGELPADYQDYLCAGSCFGKTVLLNALDFKYSADADAWAAYGQFDYTLTDRLTAVLGMRWSVDEKSLKLTNEFSDIGLATLEADHSWNHFDPAFTLTYEWTDDLLVYAKYSTGYRSGGYNIRATTVNAFERPANEEEVTSWEIGGKSEWFDNRVRLNGAAFYYEYDDRQVNQFEAGTGGASSIIVNAGASEAKGVELDLTISVTDSALLMLTYGHVEVEYNKFITSVSDPVTGFPEFDANGDAVVADISDTASTISNGPEDTAAMILQYTFPASGIGTFVAQVDASYAGKRTFQAQMNLYDAADSYTLWNARLTLQEIPVAHGELSLALWGRNLGDEEVREYGIDFGVLGYAVNTYKELRSVGADLRYEF